MHWLIILLILCALAAEVAGNKWKAVDVPNPFIDVQYCGNKGVKRWICDPDNYLEQSEKERIQEKINMIFTNLNATCADEVYGYQVGVLIIEKIESSSFWFSTTAEHFSKDVFD